MRVSPARRHRAFVSIRWARRQHANGVDTRWLEDARSSFAARRRLLVVTYTECSGRIRLIRARTATLWERHDYEQEQTHAIAYCRGA